MSRGWTWASRRGLYSTKGWRKLRKIKIDNNPICEMCITMKKVTPATRVDHIEPITEVNWEELFLDYSNLQSLCDACHKFKTARDKIKRDGATGHDLEYIINNP